MGNVGPVTGALAHLYRDFHDASIAAPVIAPKSLFGALTAKAVRFRGYAQQDAHELLKYALELLTSEETQRVQVPPSTSPCGWGLNVGGI